MRKRWHDRPFQPKLKKLQQARSQDYREAYSNFQADRRDLIARQQTERIELQTMWLGARQGTSRQSSQSKTLDNAISAGPLCTLRAGLRRKSVEHQLYHPERTAEMDIKQKAAVRGEDAGQILTAKQGGWKSSTTDKAGTKDVLISEKNVLPKMGSIQNRAKDALRNLRDREIAPKPKSRDRQR